VSIINDESATVITMALLPLVEIPHQSADTIWTLKIQP